MSRFAHLDKRKANGPATPESQPEPSQPRVVKASEPAGVAPEPIAAARTPAPRAKAREGKKAVIGYFSPDLSRELLILSATEGVTMQALLGEAIDLLMHDRGRNRFNER